MHNLENAVALADQLRDALRVEVERARAERGLIRAMDVHGLMRGAAARAEFNALVVRRQTQLRAELGLAAGSLGRMETVIERLRAAAPVLTERLSASLAEARSLALALAELDELNRLLGQRALQFVRAYLGAINPRPAAYDRRGLATAAAAAAARTSATMSRVV
jgi:hypothetical protein